MSVLEAPGSVQPRHEGVPIPTRTFPGPRTRKAGSIFLNVYAGLALVYLFMPIFIIVLFSFNQPKGKFNIVWQQFTLDNWKDPFKIPELVDAFTMSLKIALFATVVAVAFGALIALALCRYRFTGSGATNLLLILPLTAPEIVLGASLASMFISLGVDRGFATTLIAHIMFCVAFVALTVKARLRGFDWTLEDAAMDLGAPPMRVFRKVTFPLMIPGILAAALLSFALSLDDFVITLFNAGPGSKSITTFPIYIYGATQRAIPPQINVLATIVLVASIALLGAGTLIQRLRERNP
jgi:spermidine/putrescine transport system permease protein